jgi:hypothetical protein
VAPTTPWLISIWQRAIRDTRRSCYPPMTAATTCIPMTPAIRQWPRPSIFRFSISRYARRTSYHSKTMWGDTMKPSGAGVLRAQKGVGSHKCAPAPRDVAFCGRGHQTPSHHHALRFALVHSNHRNALGHGNVEAYRELPPGMSHAKLVFRVRPVGNHPDGGNCPRPATFLRTGPRFPRRQGFLRGGGMVREVPYFGSTLRRR